MDQLNIMNHLSLNVYHFINHACKFEVSFSGASIILGRGGGQK